MIEDVRIIFLKVKNQQDVFFDDHHPKYIVMIFYYSNIVLYMIYVLGCAWRCSLLVLVLSRRSDKLIVQNCWFSVQHFDLGGCGDNALIGE